MCAAPWLRSGDGAAGGSESAAACMPTWRLSARAAREEGLENAQPDLNRLCGCRECLARPWKRRPIPTLEQPLLAALEEALDSAQPVPRARRRGAGGRDAGSQSRHSQPAPRNGADIAIARHSRLPEAPGREADRNCSATPRSIRSAWRRRRRSWPTAAISAKRCRGCRSTPGNWMRCWTSAAKWARSSIFCCRR